MGKRKNKNKAMPLSIQWSAQNDQELKVILEDEIRTLGKRIADAPNPTKKKKLRDTRKKYQALLSKVDVGDYGSEQFFLKEQNRGVYVNPYPQEDSSAISAYDDISFQYDTFFRKKRYYGFMLPILTLVLLIGFLILPFLGNVLPAKMQNDLGGKSIHLGAVFTYKIDEKHDITVPNDGLWPTGVWAEGKFLKHGEKYVTPAGATPESVSLFRDLGIRSIDVTALDIVKSFFFLDIMSGTRIDFIEDLDFMKGTSWFYSRFMFDQMLTVTKNADGSYNISEILRVVSTFIIIYGTIIALFATVLSIIFAFISMFTYTSRRIHFLPVIAAVCNILVFILPVFLTAGEVELKDAFSAFFTFSGTKFADKVGIQLMCGIIPIINIAISVLLIFLPKMFKNKTAKYQTYVPKGNKPPRKPYNIAER